MLYHISIRSNQVKMSFQEKSIWISLILTILIFGHYFYRAVRVFSSPDLPESKLIALFIGAVFTLIIIQIASQSILAFSHKKEAAQGKDERDHFIQFNSSRVSYFILAVGVWAAGISMLFHTSTMIMANIIMGFFILAETVGYAAQLIMYRRGA